MPLRMLAVSNVFLKLTRRSWPEVFTAGGGVRWGREDAGYLGLEEEVFWSTWFFPFLKLIDILS